MNRYIFFLIIGVGAVGLRFGLKALIRSIRRRRRTPRYEEYYEREVVDY